MQIDEIILRNKTLTLFNSPAPTMGIEIKNHESKVIRKEENSVSALKGINLKVVNKENNDLIADFKLVFQCKVNLSADEDFSEIDFMQKMLPVFFTQMNNMLGEMFLPRIPYDQFCSFAKKTK